MELFKSLHVPKKIPQSIRSNWIGLVVILFATLIFFGPVLIRIGNYSEGGDAMFNAWTLARDQHCILREGCPSYVNGNIFFPHTDSMLYSETQLSAGLLSLPLYFIDQNPIFSYNVCMIVSFFLMGYFMYLLVKYLSKNNEFIAVLGGLLFEFSPFRMPAISHLQNSSIFYLPLAVLLLLKFLQHRKRSSLIGLFVVLVLQFYASWYQMVFVLIALGVLIGGIALLKLAQPRQIVSIIIVVCLATLSTYPLARSYTQFSKANSANFSIESQATYSSSLLDYVTPTNGTLLGDIFYKLDPHAHLNSYDTDSYSYYGITLIVLAVGVVVIAYRQRKRGLQAIQKYKMLIIFTVIGLAGVIISFGPLLKVRNSYTYHFSSDGLSYVIPLPYILVDKFLPQLSFMRALGRSGVLLLFSLCCMLAYAPATARKLKIPFYQEHRVLINTIAVALIVFELLPFHQEPMSSNSYSYNLNVPAVYQFIKNDAQVNNIIVLAADADYPHAGIPTELPEETLWAGYDNKNTFNGYSGYLPPDYYPTYWNFLDFRAADVPLLKQEDLRYVMVDKLLSTSNPGLANQVAGVLGKNHVVYQDKRYVLFKVAD